jgi:3'(2'), 5'-bisphosphate nucleotidase
LAELRNINGAAPAVEVSREDHDFAARSAARAGELLLELRAGLERPDADVQALRDAGDRSSHELLMRSLAEEYPADGVLSEEGKLDPARLEARRVWIVDPLDGTREFGEEGRTDWAVHVALAVDGIPRAGAVALPARGLTMTTEPAPELPVRIDRPPRLVVSRTRPSELALGLAERLDVELVPMGSAGAKAMAVVLGEADVYAHSGGQYEWDSAAPAAVAAAAGLHVSRFDGSPLLYNRADPWLPDLLICRPELAQTFLAELAA